MPCRTMRTTPGLRLRKLRWLRRLLFGLPGPGCHRNRTNGCRLRTHGAALTNIGPTERDHPQLRERKRLETEDCAYLSDHEDRFFHFSPTKNLAPSRSAPAGDRDAHAHPEAHRASGRCGRRHWIEPGRSDPGALIEKAIASLPKRDDVTLYGRDPKHDVTFIPHQPSLACMTMAVNVIDPHTRSAVRQPTKTWRY